MSELTEKVDDLLKQQSPRTFEEWVTSRSEEDQEAIQDALDYAHRTRSYMPAWRVLSQLHDNPWQGSVDAMRAYAIRVHG